MKTFFTDNAGTYRNAGDLILNLSKLTYPKFSDVGKELLQLCVGGNLEPLFADNNKDYFWEYDNYGLKLGQLRFYDVSTTPIGGSCSSTSGI